VPCSTSALSTAHTDSKVQYPSVLAKFECTQAIWCANCTTNREAICETCKPATIDLDTDEYSDDIKAKRQAYAARKANQKTDEISCQTTSQADISPNFEANSKPPSKSHSKPDSTAKPNSFTRKRAPDKADAQAH